MGNKVDNTIKFNNEYEFEIMEDNRIRDDYFNSGNYLINKGIEITNKYGESFGDMND